MQFKAAFSNIFSILIFSKNCVNQLVVKILQVTAPHFPSSRNATSSRRLTANKCNYNTIFSPHLNFADFPINFYQAICFLFLLVTQTNVIIEIRSILLFTLYNNKNIAYHITEELIFYAHKIMAMGNLKNSRVFNFTVLLKS